MSKTLYIRNGHVAAVRLEGEPIQGQESFGDPLEVAADLAIGVGDPAPVEIEPEAAPTPEELKAAEEVLAAAKAAGEAP